MPDDAIELEQELRSVAHEKRRILKQIEAFQQYMRADEIWLRSHPAEAEDSQEAREELVALEAYIGELQSQVIALDDLLLELRMQRDLWETPDLLLVS